MTISETSLTPVALAVSLCVTTAHAAMPSMNELADAAREKRAERLEDVQDFAVLQTPLAGIDQLVYYKGRSVEHDGEAYPVFHVVPLDELARAHADVSGAPDLSPNELRAMAGASTLTGVVLGVETERSMSEAGLPPELLSMGGNRAWNSAHPTDIFLDSSVLLSGAADHLEERESRDGAAEARQALADLESFIEQAEVVGEETVDGRAAYHARADGLDHVQTADDMEFTTEAVSMWIDAEELVPLRLRIEGQARHDGESRELAIERVTADYRRVPDCGDMYYPYRTVMRIDGMFDAEQQHEMQEAQAQLAELEQQMAAMPKAQRDMIMSRMGPQMEMMKKMASSGGAIETETQVREVHCNIGEERAFELAMAATEDTFAPGAAGGGQFHMPIADAFEIAGGGIVATGEVAAGTVAVGDRICLHSARVGTREVEVLGLEKFRKVMGSASAGERIGIMISDVESADVAAGDELRGSCN